MLLDVLTAGAGRGVGTYIDVGCNHPKRFSNTYALYRAGWRGLAVDLDPSLCKQFRLARPYVSMMMRHSPSLQTIRATRSVHHAERPVFQA